LNVTSTAPRENFSQWEMVTNCAGQGQGKAQVLRKFGGNQSAL